MTLCQFELTHPDMQDAVDAHVAEASQEALGSPTPSAAVATPCRAAAGREKPVETVAGEGLPETPSPLSEVPSLDDTSAQKPQPGHLRLSPTAINQRMNRVFQPSNRTGKFKVSEEILAMYGSKSGKQKLSQVVQSCGYDPDMVWKRMLIFWALMLKFGKFQFAFKRFPHIATQITTLEGNPHPCRTVSSKNVNS